MTSDALRGHLDALIMSVLEQEPLHGYAIIDALRVRSGGRVDLPTGTVYPALRRLERLGHLDSTWSTVSGRRRRTYRLTKSGAAVLAGERKSWTAISSAIEAILSPAR